MNKNELKEGEIYNYKIYNFVYIVKLDIENNIPRFRNGFGGIYVYDNNENQNQFGKERTLHYLHEGIFTKATPEEKHWLNTCISADKFISYEEAMKSFIPEYVECIKLFHYNWSLSKGKIYKFPKPIDDEGVERKYITNWKRWNDYFKPSTKEAYDAQFKDKLSSETLNKIVEFNKNLKVVKPFEILKQRKATQFIEQVINEEGNIFMIGDIITPTITDSPNKGKGFKITGFRLNNDKSMICAITDTHTPNGIGIDKIEHFIEKDEFVLPEKWCIKNTDNIIGDYFNKMTNTRDNLYNKSWHKNNYLHSHSFRDTSLIDFSQRNIDKSFSNIRIRESFTEITFDQFKKYVLKEEKTFENFGKKVDEIIIAQSHSDQLKLKQSGIDSIVIPNETLLEKAKRLYPVGTKFIPTMRSSSNNYEISSGDLHLTESGNYIVDRSNSRFSVYFKNRDKWATIIEDEPKVGDRFVISTKATSYYEGLKFDNTTIFTIHSIEDNIVKFIGGYGVIETVLLKNIKIIK